MKTIPKNETRSSYSEHAWIDKATLTLLKERSIIAEATSRKKKEFEYEKRGEYDLIKRVFVKDIHTNHTTEVLFTDIKSRFRFKR